MVRDASASASITVTVTDVMSCPEANLQAGADDRGLKAEERTQMSGGA